MRVLLSARRSALTEAHGGPILARRHAQALARRGIEAFLMAPEPPPGARHEGVSYLGYAAPQEGSSYLPGLRRNEGAARALRGLVGQVRPDILYDVGGPLWPVEAAIASGIPVVSVVGDYNWFCARSFLVDSLRRRCSGPESAAKCFECETRDHPLKRRLVQGVLRRAAEASWPPIPELARLAPYRIWEELGSSHAWVAKLRQGVDRFVVGDRQARRFFESHGVPPAKFACIEQALPREALARRPRLPWPPRFAPQRPMRVGFVGRLDVEKGFHVLAAAFEALPEEAPVQLAVIHVHDATERKVGAAFSDEVRFRRALAAGRVSLVRPGDPDALYREMARLDVGVVPSLAYESPSLAMMEMAAQGTPILRSESDGMSHVIQDGVNGRTFPYGDAAALRALLQEMLATPAILARYSAALPSIAGDDSYAASLEAVFKPLLAARAGAMHG